MLGKIVNDGMQSEIDEDVYVAALERERDWIEKRRMAIYAQEHGNRPKLHSDCGAEWNALNTRLDFINRQLCRPDEEKLWTSDEVSAQLTEEELAKARERLESVNKHLDYLREFADMNGSWRSVAKEVSWWAKIAEERQREVFRLEDLLIDNPASDWLPF